MNKRTIAVALLLLVAVAAYAAKRVDPNLYRSKSKQDAAKALSDLAQKQAGKGSWENLAVARLYYLSGRKADGQAIIDRVSSRKPEGGDWLRIGRIYYDAGEWEKAKDPFERALKEERDNATWLAEIGAYYNIKGDRAKAEELFERAFKEEPEEVWVTTNIAGSYAGLEPIR